MSIGCRALLGSWADDPNRAGLPARDLALAMARAHLSSGLDMVVPQFEAQAAFVEQLEQVAAEVGAEFHEIVLLDSLESSIEHFDRRTDAALDPRHVEAAEIIERAGGRVALATVYEALLALVASRPGARIVRTEHDQVERAYDDMVAQLRRPPR
jgi:hypothetical protein